VARRAHEVRAVAQHELVAAGAARDRAHDGRGDEARVAVRELVRGVDLVRDLVLRERVGRQSALSSNVPH
jgi:hypothetical protein